MLVYFLFISSIVFVGLFCGKKKNKNVAPKSTAKPAPKTQTTKSIAPPVVEIPAALQSKKEETPVPANPEPTKLAEILPETEKSEKLEGGIKLPEPVKLHTEGELEQAKKIIEEQKKAAAEKKEAEKKEAEKKKKEAEKGKEKGKNEDEKDKDKEESDKDTKKADNEEKKVFEHIELFLDRL